MGTRRWFRKVLKIISVLLVLLFLVVIILFYRMFGPKSDEDFLETLKTESTNPVIEYVSYEDKEVRTIHMQRKINNKLPTLLFIHGSPGSSLDFKSYLMDKSLNRKYNIIAYDRIGYGENYRGEVLNSLEEEVELLHAVIGNMKSSDIVLIGYSYGGTTALASEKKYKKKILLAAAVRGDLEPMFWAMKLLDWDFTRQFVPKVFRAAAIEKQRHLTELLEYENQWDISKTKIISIHGKKDMIVPYQNSIFLENKLDPDMFELITLENGRHDLIWTNFSFIKKVILKRVD